MNTNIFVPKKIKVGFQNRSDTYTKQLAYIIYFDEKGKLRKEKSWESWRDEKIEPQEFDNVPTSGFVLNKKVGDYVSDWNHRQAYVRVYDPRGFEFEITIENLLYVLENATSTKGKGLEGDFIYAWSNKDLVLVPVESPDYQAISKYNEILHERNTIKAKDLIIGATYRAKNNDEWIYMGRFDYYKNEYEYVPCNRTDWRGRTYTTTECVRKNVNKGKHHYFTREHKSDYSDTLHMTTIQLKGLGDRFIEVVSTDCVENYAELFEKLESNIAYSPYDASKDEYVPYTLDEVVEIFEKRRWFYFYNFEKIECELSYYQSRSYESKIKGTYCAGTETTETTETIEELFNIVKPMYKNEYLANGKFYRRIH